MNFIFVAWYKILTQNIVKYKNIVSKICISLTIERMMFNHDWNEIKTRQWLILF